ncbi:MAG: universal stress protein [Anaerolineales bacterium]|nr:universal stress protein [Anaerolineales bacterium]
MKIMLCTDGSVHAQGALRFGSMIARYSQAPATLVGVLKKPYNQTFSLISALNEGLVLLEGAPKPSIQVCHGDVAREILTLAERNNFNLVVIGACERRGVKRYFLDAVTERIARCAATSVLIARCTHPEIKRVLLCTIGARINSRIIGIGGRVAQLAGASATLLHVSCRRIADPAASLYFNRDHVQTDRVVSAQRMGKLGILRQAAEYLEAQGVQAQTHLRQGYAADEILAEADQGDYDLVVVGVNSTGGGMKYVLDDITHQLMIEITRPLLIVR